RRDDPEGGEALHHDREDVLPPDETAVEEREAHRHQHDKGGAHEHEGGVAGVDGHPRSSLEPGARFAGTSRTYPWRDANHDSGSVDWPAFRGGRTGSGSRWAVGACCTSRRRSAGRAWTSVVREDSTPKVIWRSSFRRRPRSSCIRPSLRPEAQT